MTLTQSNAVCNPEVFPLKGGRRFVTWVLEARASKPTKVPKIATTEGVYGASHSDPSTWRPWDEAIAAYATGRFTGIGRMFAAEDGIVGVDFDDVLNPETGEIDPDTLDWLRALDSYTEISPSLTGVKVWVRANIERTRKKGGLEVYRDHRFFTVTGNRLEQYSAEVEERQEAVEALLNWYFPPAERRVRSVSFEGEATDLTKFLEDNGVEILADMHDGTADLKYGIVCPWVEEHTDEDDSGTRVGQYTDGALFFHCEHSHCAGRKWVEFRDKVSPRIVGLKRNPRVLAAGKAVSLDV